MKKKKPPKIIKHKARHHLKHDSCELPYRTTYCDDEHHIEVIVGHWNKVTCPLCLEEKNNYKNKKQTLPKTNEMKLKHLERRQQFKNDWNKRPPQKEEETKAFKQLNDIYNNTTAPTTKQGNIKTIYFSLNIPNI